MVCCDRDTGYETKTVTVVERTAATVDGILRDLSKEYAQFEKQGGILDDHTRRIEEIEGTLNGRHGQTGMVRQLSELQIAHQTKNAEQRGEIRAHSRAGTIVKILWGAITGAAMAGAAVLGNAHGARKIAFPFHPQSI
ncbi:MAG: hypothetical protein ACYC5H_12410 [Methylovirgula sp.]